MNDIISIRKMPKARTDIIHVSVLQYRLKMTSLYLCTIGENVHVTCPTGPSIKCLLFHNSPFPRMCLSPWQAQSSGVGQRKIIEG